jgi:hypothetical protein
MGTRVSVVTRAQAIRNSEVAYDRQSHIGKLEKAFDEASQRLDHRWHEGRLEDGFPSCQSMINRLTTNNKADP